MVLRGVVLATERKPTGTHSTGRVDLDSTWYRYQVPVQYQVQYPVE